MSACVAVSDPSDTTTRATFGWGSMKNRTPVSIEIHSDRCFLSEMALSITPRVFFSPATEDPKPSSFRSCNKVSYSYSFTVVLDVGSRKVVERQPRSVKAMAVAKYRGTWMREKKLAEMIEKKVMEAEVLCEGNEASDECRVVWDEVEEVSQAKADLRKKMEKHDPLEYFCQENPETDECRIYED